MTQGITNRPYADRSLQRGGVWERGSFTVPITTPHERVMEVKGRYQNRFGEHLEAQGFTVLAMTDPVEADEPGVDLDRRKYLLHAWCRRRPQDLHIYIPDEAVPEMMNLGLRLME